MPKIICFSFTQKQKEKHDKLFFGDKEQVILKKYFYVIRPLLCIEWLRLKLIENQANIEKEKEKERELPPMILIDLLNDLPIENKDCRVDKSLKESIAVLIEKKTKSNLGVGPRIILIDSWISTSWQFYGDYCKKIPKQQIDRNNLSPFDLFFQSIVKQSLSK